MKTPTASALAILLLTGTVAQATQISVVTDAPPGTSLQMMPNTTSGDMTLSVVHDTFPNAASNFLSGFQIALQIAPQAGATGSLTFVTPASGAGLPEPSNYVFDSVSNLGLGATNTGNELFLFDLNDPFSGGVDVPTAPGKNITAITFQASVDALGLFDIVAVPGTANTEWTDSATPDQVNHAFANVPVGGGAVPIGQVSVVPEPTTVLLTLLGITVGFLPLRCGRRVGLRQSKGPEGSLLFLD